MITELDSLIGDGLPIMMDANYLYTLSYEDISSTPVSYTTITSQSNPINNFNGSFDGVFDTHQSGNDDLTNGKMTDIRNKLNALKNFNATFSHLVDLGRNGNVETAYNVDALKFYDNPLTFIDVSFDVWENLDISRVNHLGDDYALPSTKFEFGYIHDSVDFNFDIPNMHKTAYYTITRELNKMINTLKMLFDSYIGIIDSMNNISKTNEVLSDVSVSIPYNWDFGSIINCLTRSQNDFFNPYLIQPEIYGSDTDTSFNAYYLNYYTNVIVRSSNYYEVNKFSDYFEEYSFGNSGAVTDVSDGLQNVLNNDDANFPFSSSGIYGIRNGVLAEQQNASEPYKSISYGGSPDPDTPYVTLSSIDVSYWDPLKAYDHSGAVIPTNQEIYDLLTNLELEDHLMLYYGIEKNIIYEADLDDRNHIEINNNIHNLNYYLQTNENNIYFYCTNWFECVLKSESLSSAFSFIDISSIIQSPAMKYLDLYKNVPLAFNNSDNRFLEQYDMVRRPDRGFIDPTEDAYTYSQGESMETTGNVQGDGKAVLFGDEYHGWMAKKSKCIREGQWSNLYGSPDAYAYIEIDLGQDISLISFKTAGRRMAYDNSGIEGLGLFVGTGSDDKSGVQFDGGNSLEDWPSWPTWGHPPISGSIKLPPEDDTADSWKPTDTIYGRHIGNYKIRRTETEDDDTYYGPITQYVKKFLVMYKTDSGDWQFVENDDNISPKIFSGENHAPQWDGTFEHPDNFNLLEYINNNGVELTPEQKKASDHLFRPRYGNALDAYRQRDSNGRYMWWSGQWGGEFYQDTTDWLERHIYTYGDPDNSYAYVPDGDIDSIDLSFDQQGNPITIVRPTNLTPIPRGQSGWHSNNNPGLRDYEPIDWREDNGGREGRYPKAHTLWGNKTNRLGGMGYNSSADVSGFILKNVRIRVNEARSELDPPAEPLTGSEFVTFSKEVGYYNNSWPGLTYDGEYNSSTDRISHSFGRWVQPNCQHTLSVPIKCRYIRIFPLRGEWNHYPVIRVGNFEYISSQTDGNSIVHEFLQQRLLGVPTNNPLYDEYTNTWVNMEQWCDINGNKFRDMRWTDSEGNDMSFGSDFNYNDINPGLWNILTYPQRITSSMNPNDYNVNEGYNWLSPQDHEIYESNYRSEYPNSSYLKGILEQYKDYTAWSNSHIMSGNRFPSLDLTDPNNEYFNNLITLYQSGRFVQEWLTISGEEGVDIRFIELVSDNSSDSFLLNYFDTNIAPSLGRDGTVYLYTPGTMLYTEADLSGFMLDNLIHYDTVDCLKTLSDNIDLSATYPFTDPEFGTSFSHQSGSYYRLNENIQAWKLWENIKTIFLEASNEIAYWSGQAELDPAMNVEDSTTDANLHLIQFIVSPYTRRFNMLGAMIMTDISYDDNGDIIESDVIESGDISYVSSDGDNILDWTYLNKYMNILETNINYSSPSIFPEHSIGSTRFNYSYFLREPSENPYAEQMPAVSDGSDYHLYSNEDSNVLYYDKRYGLLGSLFRMPSVYRNEMRHGDFTTKMLGFNPNDQCTFQNGRYKMGAKNVPPPIAADARDRSAGPSQMTLIATTTMNEVEQRAQLKSVLEKLYDNLVNFMGIHDTAYQPRETNVTRWFSEVDTLAEEYNLASIQLESSIDNLNSPEPAWQTAASLNETQWANRTLKLNDLRIKLGSGSAVGNITDNHTPEVYIRNLTLYREGANLDGIGGHNAWRVNNTLTEGWSVGGNNSVEGNGIIGRIYQFKIKPFGLDYKVLYDQPSRPGIWNDYTDHKEMRQTRNLQWTEFSSSNDDPLPGVEIETPFQYSSGPASVGAAGAELTMYAWQIGYAYGGAGYIGPGRVGDPEHGVHSLYTEGWKETGFNSTGGNTGVTYILARLCMRNHITQFRCI